MYLSEAQSFALTNWLHARDFAPIKVQATSRQIVAKFLQLLAATAPVLHDHLYKSATGSELNFEDEGCSLAKSVQSHKQGEKMNHTCLPKPGQACKCAGHALDSAVLQSSSLLELQKLSPVVSDASTSASSLSPDLFDRYLTLGTDALVRNSVEIITSQISKLVKCTSASDIHSIFNGPNAAIIG